jgi:hypothetical protein
MYEVWKCEGWINNLKESYKILDVFFSEYHCYW